MIKKTIIFTLFLFVLWTLFVTYSPQSGIYQQQRQDNVIKAQQYVYCDTAISNVIVGTSISCRLKTDSLPGFYNLSFGGLSIYDGLAIIKEKKLLPEYVFVETNLLFKEKNDAFYKDIFSPLSYYSKKYIVALREYNQPATHFVAVMTHEANRMKQEKNQGIPVEENREKDIANPEAFEFVLTNQVKDFSNVPDTAYREARLDALKEDIDYLQSKGVKIVFFEVPVNSKLVNLPLPQTTRRQLKTYFPENKNTFYINLPDDYMEYIGSDGLHLGKIEGMMYTRYFRNKALEIERGQGYKNTP